MRIGIITHWWSLDNYGQQLQCYALQTLLRSWGHDAYLIRYLPKGKTPTIWQKLKALILHPNKIIYHLPFDTKRKRSVRYEQELRDTNQRNNPQRRFEQFRQENLQITERIYESYKDLHDNPPEADVYIAGSDQIWRPPINSDSAAGWFLWFGDESVRRISYAASMGEGIPAQELPLLKELLSHFDAVSVREESSNKVCRDLGVESQVCIDPTMLLPIDSYRHIEVRLENHSPYAFIYVLNVRTAEDFYWPQISVYLEEERLQVKSVTGSGYYQGRELIENNKNLLLTIQEWLGCMEGASCVITTSFHGTVFAILMHRPFLVIGLQGKFSGANTRIEQLLLKLDIAERIFNPNKSVREQMEAIIDWEMVDQRIAEMQKSSIEFLKGNLYKKKWK